MKEKVFTQKLSAKVISFILCLLIVFLATPSIIFAKAIEAAQEISVGEVAHDTSALGTEDSTQSIYDVNGSIYEVVSEREENVKHFHLEDGTYIAAEYSTPVHTLDENGKWVDINNRLEDSGSSYSTENEKIKFEKKINGSEKLLTLKDGNTKITLSLIGAAKGTVAEVTNGEDASELTELQKFMNLENISSKIIYRDALDGVDIEYIIKSNDVKENIIVKEMQDSYSYTFDLRLNGMTATLTNAGDISISDANGEKYIIPAPIVYDAAITTAPEGAAYFTLNGREGRYTLTITVDAEWMNAEERIFPVTVDPTITFAGGKTIDYASYEGEALNERYINYPLMVVGAGIDALWRINTLANIPESAYVSGVELHIPYHSSQGRFFPVLALSQVTSSWNPDDIFSTTERPVIGDVISESTVSYVSGIGYVYNFDITELANVWRNDESANNGVHLLNTGKDCFGLKPTVRLDPNGYVGSYVYTAPTFTVRYANMSGIEGYWTSASHSAGLAGVGTVNHANGALHLAVPLGSTMDSILPYTVSMVYDSSRYNSIFNYLNSAGQGITNYLPRGVMLTLNESVIMQEDNNFYTYLDSDGTVHNMKDKVITNSDGSKTVLHIDEDGLQLVSCIEGNKMHLTDDSNITKTFLRVPENMCVYHTTIWYLSSISDEIGNQIIFNYDNELKPVSISFKPVGMQAIEYLTFVYASDGKLCGVFNEINHEATVIRYANESGTLSASGEYLYGFEYLKGGEATTGFHVFDYYNTYDDSYIEPIAYARYTYDNYHRIIKAYDSLLNQSLEYTWYNLSVQKISHYAGDTLGQQLEFRYGTGYTDVVQTGNDEVLGTDDDIVSRYVFDDRGRTVSTYSFAENSSVILGGTVGVYETHESVKNNLKEQTTIGGTNVNLLINGDFEDVYTANGTTGILYWNTTGTVSAEQNSTLESNNGLYAAKLSPTATDTASITQLVRLKAGVYTFSLVSDSAESKNVSAEVCIRTSDGNIVCEGLYGSQKNATLTQPYYVTTFEIESESGDEVIVEITVTVDCIDASKYNEYTNYVLIDSVSLEEGAGASQLSKIELGGFDEISVAQSGDAVRSINDLWHISANDNSVGVVTVGNSAFGNVLKIDSNGTGYAWQRIFEYTPTGDVGTEFNPNNNADMQFIVSAYAQSAYAISGGVFKIRVDVTYYKGEGEDDVVISKNFDFVPSCHGWQFTAGRLDTSENAPTMTGYSIACVKAIDVYCEFNGSMGGYALFDNISVVCDIDNTTEYYYYTEGTLDGLLARTSSRYYTEMYEYDGKRRLTTVSNNLWKMTEYVYESEDTDLVIYEVYSDYEITTPITKTPRTKTEYEYNTLGQLTNTTTYEVCWSADNTEIVAKSGTNSVITTYEYYTDISNTAYFGAIKKQTNGVDRSTLYFYDGTYGYLLATVDEYSGTGTAYSYDYMGNLAGVLPVSYSEGIYTEITNAHSVSYLYDSNNRLSSVMTDSTVYNFTYDAFGNSTTVQVGSNTIASYEYYENNGKLKKVIYANGFVVKYVYNTLEKISEVWYNYNNGSEQLAYSYEYTANGAVYKETDHLLNRETIYKYDDQDRLLAIGNYSSGTNVHEVQYSYDEKSRLSNVYQRIDYLANGTTQVAQIRNRITYNADNRLGEEGVESDKHKTTLYYTYDDFGRVVLTESYSGNGTGASTININTSYEYREFGASQTDSVLSSAITTVNGVTSEVYEFEYDERGYITAIYFDDGSCIHYTYDILGQLVREDNERLGETYIYTYDNAGNILFKYVYNLTYADNPSGFKAKKQYVYGNSQWGDLLTAYNGQNITYDEIGNPLKYYNGYRFTWNGRQMKTVFVGTATFAFQYNEDGLRTVKMKNNGEITTYYYYGNLLISEQTQTETFIYHYTSGGSIIGMSYRNASYATGAFDTYVFEKNILGDIVAVYDLNGTKLVSYTYDAWGNFTTSYSNGTTANSVAARNPFKYRGYYYDKDLGLYYLQTRYYDSVTGRFINADGYVSTGQGMLGNNMFAYCNNNPVMFTDPTGEWPRVRTLEYRTRDKIAGWASCIIQELKEAAYSAYYSATYWHFEGREALNGTHPSYEDVNAEDSGWVKLPESQSIYHDNGKGKPEEKYITSDGREAVFDGDTLQPVTDPQYMGTYNYCPIYQLPDDGVGISDYGKLVTSYAGHFFVDIVPYYLTGNSNTREQFESKFWFFNRVIYV